MKAQWKILAAIGSLLISASTLKALADANPVALYDWTIAIQTQKLDRQFQYKNSKLTEIERLDVDYYDKDNVSSPSHVAFESLWYCKGKALGLERFADFSIPKGESMSIYVSHKTQNPSNAELQAAANMVMRAWLLSQINQNAVLTVRVPQQSYSQIVNYLLTEQHMVVTAPALPEEDRNIPMQLTVETYPKGQSITLNYM